METAGRNELQVFGLVMCCKEMPILKKIRVLPAGTLSQTLLIINIGRVFRRNAASE